MLEFEAFSDKMAKNQEANFLTDLVQSHKEKNYNSTTQFLLTLFKNCHGKQCSNARNRHVKATCVKNWSC